MLNYQYSVITLYEDDMLKVFYSSGRSDFLLVTFGDLLSKVDGDSFFADAPVKKLGLNCLGFVAKGPNWYPVPNVALAIKACEQILANFKEIVTYGGSMGGYAALKYSRRLGAVATIAMCPQWSLDPDECGGFDSGWRKFFVPNMMDMGVTKYDLAGNIFVLYDPGNETDNFHARKILDLSHSISALRTRSVDHHVTSVFAGTKNLESFVQCALNNDYHAMSSVVQSVRRRHPTRERILLNRLSINHCGLLDSLLSAQGRRLSDEDKVALNVKVLTHYLRSGRESLISGPIERLISLNIDIVRKTLLENFLNASGETGAWGGSKALTTAHGTCVYYSALMGRLIHRVECSLEKRQYLTAPLVDIGDRCAGVEINGRRYYLMIDKNGFAGFSDCKPSPENPNALWVQHEADGIKLIRAGFYAAAEKNGSISYNRKIAKAWETFV